MIYAGVDDGLSQRNSLYTFSTLYNSLATKTFVRNVYAVVIDKLVGQIAPEHDCKLFRIKPIIQIRKSSTVKLPNFTVLLSQSCSYRDENYNVSN